MNLPIPFLQGRVSRRMFTLFVLCALVPIVALALVTYTSVRTQLATETEERLRQSSRALGMAVIERLGFLEDDMMQRLAKWEAGSNQLPTASFERANSDRPGRLVSLGVMTSDGASVSLIGQARSSDLSPKEKQHLQQGKPVLHVQASVGEPSRVLLIHSFRSEGTPERVMVGEVNADYLWGIGSQDTLPSGMSLTAMAGGRILATTHEGGDTLVEQLRPEMSVTSTGAFEWASSDEHYLAGYWTLPLAFRYGTNQWTLILSQRSSDALAPIRVFSQSFALVILLSLGVVILISSIQIRTNLVPLEKLQEGTRRIARRDFKSRVTLESNDEFQDLATSFNDMAARLDKQFATLHTIGEIDRAVLSLLDVSRIVEVVLTRMDELAPIAGGGVLLLDHDESGTALVYTRARSNALGVQVEVVTLPAGERHAILANRERLVVPAAEGATWMRQCGGPQIGSFTVYPLLRSETLLGCVVIATRAGEKIEPDDDTQLRRLADQIAVALTNATDVARRKQAEDHLRESNRQLERAMQELKATQKQMVQQERLRALGQMASGIAHDFNNALYPIVGFTELLLLNPAALDNKALVTERLETMNLAARDAAKIVSRLRDFYRPREDHGLALPVDLPQLIRQTITLTQPKWKDQAHANGLTVELRTELQPVAPVAGDESELREVFTNLLFNAVDAMRHRGTITFRTHMDGAQVVVEVEDTGTGMTEEVRQRCLEPFFSTKGDKGTGLGLAMVYGIIRRFGGTVDIDSTIGRGTTFLLRFPAADLSAMGHQAISTEPLPKDWHVLVVDDDRLVGSVTEEYLKASGQRVERVENGLDAVARCRTERFDLVVTDHGMPDMNGRELAGLVKGLSQSTAIVMLSGAGDPEWSLGASTGAVDATLDKPLTMAALQGVLRRLNGRRGLAAAA